MVERFDRSARKYSGVVALVAVCALSLVAAAPAAATKCVKPGGGGGCTATIQAAVDAAAEGETIVVKPGVYRERITLNKRVHLRGGGKLPSQVVINGRRILDTVTVSASGVTISNLTVWNAAQKLVVVEAAATGVTLSKLVLRQAGGQCIDSLAAGTSVIGVSIQNCGSQGVYASGDGFVMKKSSVLVSGSNCVEAAGADVQIVGNLLRACGDYGISVFPGDSSALVRGNRVISVTGSAGIYVDSPNATVQENLVDGAAEYGFDISSAHPIVSRNIAQNTRETGFLIGCPAGCTDGQVVGNRVLWSNDNGFDLWFDGAAAVSGNVAQGVAGTGFYLQGAGPYDVRQNAAKGADYSCFDLKTNALLVANTADSCGDSGFSVAGGTNTLQANRARNATFGFRNSVAGTVLENNTATMNGSKFCDEFNNAILTGNNFTAGDSVCTL